MTDAREDATKARWSDAVLLFAATLTLLVLCAPRVLWGPDASALFQMVQQGTDAHWMHVLYVPIARGVFRAGEALGLDPLRATAGASALGTALGVALLHRAAAALGASRGAAATVAVLAGTAPATVFFGLLLEIQGVFFAFAALAWLAAVALVRRPDVARAAALGLATGLAAMAHSSAHLLPILLGAFALSRMPRDALRPGALAAWAVAGAVAHVVPPFAFAVLTDLPTLENLRRSFGHASGDVIGDGLPLVTVVWNEWLWAFAPIALACYAALWRRGERASLLVLQIPLALYVFVTWRVLSTTWTVQETEHGAYLLPFAFPFAWFTVRGLGAARAALLAPLAIVVAVLTLHSEIDEGPPDVAPEAVVAAVGDPRGVVVLKDSRLADAVLLAAPSMVTLRLDQLLQTPDSMLDVPAAFDRHYLALSGEGRTVAFERAVLDLLELTGKPLAAHLRDRYRLEPRLADGFEVRVVLPER